MRTHARTARQDTILRSIFTAVDDRVIKMRYTIHYRNQRALVLLASLSLTVRREGIYRIKITRRQRRFLNVRLVPKYFLHHKNIPRSQRNSLATLTKKEYAVQKLISLSSYHNRTLTPSPPHIHLQTAPAHRTRICYINAAAEKSRFVGAGISISEERAT